MSRYQLYGESNPDPHSSPTLWGDVKKLHELTFNFFFGMIALIVAMVYWYLHVPVETTYDAHDYIRIVFFESRYDVEDNWNGEAGPFFFEGDDAQIQAAEWLKNRGYNNQIVVDPMWDMSLEPNYNIYDMNRDYHSTLERKDKNNRYTLTYYVLFYAGVPSLRKYYYNKDGVVQPLDTAEKDFSAWIIDPHDPNKNFDVIPNQPWRKSASTYGDIELGKEVEKFNQQLKQQVKKFD